MTLRVLEHVTDADARLVAIIMHKLRVSSIVITPDDEAAMAVALGGRCVVLGDMPGCGSIELRVVALDDLPQVDEVIN